MPYQQAIDVRKSCRNYLDAPLKPSEVAYLKQLIDTINQQTGLAFLLLEDAAAACQDAGKFYGSFSGVRAVIEVKGPSADPNLQEKLGYYGELLILEAAKLQLATCWVGGSFNRQSDILQQGAGEKLAALITVGQAQDQSFFQKINDDGVKHRKTKPLEELYTADAAVPDWFISGIKNVQKAPSALNKQKPVFHYQNGRVTASVADDFLFDLLDLGIAKLHFELGAVGRFAVGNNACFTKAD